MASRMREDIQSDRVHRGAETYLCHLSIGDRGRVLVDGDAAANADSRGGDMDQLQEEVPREVLSG